MPEAVRHASASRSESALGSLRTRARWQRRLTWALLIGLPIATVWALDLINRGPRMTAFDAADVGAYLIASVQSLLLWSSLAVLAAARRGRARHLFAVVVALLAAIVVGGQNYAYAQYATYMNFDAVRLGNAMRSSVINQLAADALNLGRHLLPPLFVAILFVFIARRYGRPLRTPRRVAWIVLPISVVAMLMLPCSYRRLQAATPDVLLLHALGRTAAMNVGLTKDTWTAPKNRQPIYVPAMSAQPAVPRNVVLVIDESVRADVTCIAYDPSCKTTPYSNAAAPDRIPLHQLRALDSATLVSLGVLWSGLSPLVPNAERGKSPLLFDLLHAAGVQTAYITSQNLDFANSRTLVEDLPLDLFVEARDLVAKPDIDLGAPDELTAAKAVDVARRFPEPYFLVVQFANVHYPFLTDPQRAPFQPSAITKDPARSEAFFNHYKNAVHLHDHATGALLRGLRALPSGARTVVIYTSDHGEAFREHGQYGHTLSIFDEEVRVPGWIDAPKGSLTEAERSKLMGASNAFLWHADLPPTILDLMGIWDAPEIARFRGRMLGTSLLRGLTEKPVPITNCTEQWGCAFRNWGVMQGGKKLEARAWDEDWHCFDVRRDPAETTDLGPAACAPLTEEARKLYREKPGD